MCLLTFWLPELIIKMSLLVSHTNFQQLPFKTKHALVVWFRVRTEHFHCLTIQYSISLAKISSLFVAIYFKVLAINLSPPTNSARPECQLNCPAQSLLCFKHFAGSGQKTVSTSAACPVQSQIAVPETQTPFAGKLPNTKCPCRHLNWICQALHSIAAQP